MSKYSLKKVYENKNITICKENFIADQEVIEEGLAQDIAFGLSSLLALASGGDKLDNVTQSEPPAITRQIEKEDEECDEGQVHGKLCVSLFNKKPSDIGLVAGGFAFKDGEWRLQSKGMPECRGKSERILW